jgi:hypothetical protein
LDALMKYPYLATNVGATTQGKEEAIEPFE